MQADLGHVAVRAVLGHLDPVAHPEHLVGLDLDARDEAEDGVPEDEQEDGGHGAEPGQERRRALLHQDRDREDPGAHPDQDLDHLGVAPHRFGAGGIALQPDDDQRVEQRVEGARARQDHPYVGHAAEVVLVELLARVVEQDPGGQVDHEGGGEVAQPLEDAVLHEHVVPAGRGA